MISELYRVIITDPSRNIFNSFEYENSDPLEQQAYSALWFALNNKREAAREILASIRDVELGLQIQSIYFEVRMVLAHSEGHNDEVIELAKEAIDLNPDAMLAYLYIGVLSNNKKATSKEAIRCLEHFLVVFPEHNGALYSLAYPLIIYDKKRKDALELVNKCKPSLRKKLFRFLIPFWGQTPLALLFIIIVAVLIFARPIPPLATFLCIFTICLVGEIVTILFAKNDRFIISVFLLFQVQAGWIYLTYKGFELLIQRVIIASAT